MNNDETAIYEKALKLLNLQTDLMLKLPRPGMETWQVVVLAMAASAAITVGLAAVLQSSK